jgi:hypothetical protein
MGRRPEFTATFLNHRRDANPWSALQAEFSRNENRPDGFPEPRTDVDRSDEAEGITPYVYSLKELGGEFR